MPRQVGCPWSECYICGLDFPEDEMVRHYKTNLLVDLGCADELAAQDYRDHMTPPTERNRTAERPVANQGAVDSGSGYGIGGWGQFPYGDPE